MENEKYKFILFISGMSVKSGYAIDNLKRICDDNFQNNFEVEIVDISIDKEKAVIYQIFALPTLIKLNPKPSRIVVGDLSDKEKVLKILGIN
jgi:circadian clock protein KaiB